MNHVPAPPSSPAVAGSSTHRHQASPRLRRDDSHESAASSSASAIAEESGSPSVDEDDPAFSPASAPSAPTRQQIQAGRQYELLLSILRDLDALVWVHLCVGYYMDTSLALLLLHAFPHLMFLTPKPPEVPPLPSRKPIVPAIMVPFVVALLVHLFMAPARGSEISRGYLHGGVILDFIGEREGQRWRCVATDVLVMIMQCIMVGVDDVRLLVKRRRMGELGAKLDNSEEPRDNQNELAPRDLQNLDAEERGVVRQELLENATTGIGTDNSQDENEIGNEEAASLLADASSSTLAGHDTSTPTPNAPLDIFYSGNAIVAEVHLLDSLRAQWHQADSATATAMALQSVGFSAGYATSSPISRRLMRQLRPAGAG